MKRYLAIYVIWAALATGGLPACSGKTQVTREEFTGLEGRVSTLENIVVGREAAKLPGGQAAAPAALPKAGKSAPSPYSGSYQEGLSYVRQKQYDRAAGIFQAFLARAPQDKLAPNARYWLGECHYARGRYQEALAEFIRCAEDYPSSAKAPDSLLKASYCYDRLGDGGRAMAAMALLLKNYPNSDAAQMVKSGRSRFAGSGLK